LSIQESSRRAFDRWTWPGLVAWAAMFCIVLLHTLLVSSLKDSTPGYREATRTFLGGETLYDLTPPVLGFVYLPGFATLYIPFEWMGAGLGDAAWKATGVALLTYAAWSNCRDIDREIRLGVFSLALVISIPLVAGFCKVRPTFTWPRPVGSLR
jgi:hypothetical protein